MSRVGITGHSNISLDSVGVVAEAIRSALRAEVDTDLVGVTCLARGADQIFAGVVLEKGGSIEVILPAKDYRERKVKSDNAPQFDELLGKARAVHTMPYELSNREAYMAAGEKVLASIDILFAVWDGAPSGGHGGTADVVHAARALGIPLVVLWPRTAVRGD